MRYLRSTLVIAFFSIFLMGWGSKDVKLTEGIQPGNVAPELKFEGLDLEGKKYVVLQCWASYDPHSRAANTQMHNVVDKVNTGDIQLVSVSFDEKESVFNGVVRTDALNPETQFVDLRGINSPLYKRLRLHAGFNNWLIDSNGVIIAKDITPDELESFLS